MRSKLFIAAGCMGFILALLFGVALYNLNTIINDNREYFVAFAEAEIGRKISLRHLGLSVGDGLSIRAKYLTVADDAAFSSAPFLRIGDLRCSVRFWPLLRKEVQVKRVIVTKPEVTLIRDASGKFNFDSLAAAREERTELSESKNPTEGADKPRRRAIPPLLALGKITDGTVRYVDRRQGLDLALRHLDLSLKAADADGVFAFDLAAALLSEKQNSKITGIFGPIVRSTLADLPIKARMELAPLDTSTVTKHLPALAAALPSGLEIGGTFQLKEAVIEGTRKAFVAKVNLDASESQIHWRDDFYKGQSVPLTMSFHTRVSKDLVELQRSVIGLRDAKIAITGTIQPRRSGKIDLVIDSNQFDASGWEKLFPALQDYQFSGRAGARVRIGTTMKETAGSEIDAKIVLPELNLVLPRLQRRLALARATLRMFAAGSGNNKPRPNSGWFQALPSTPSFSLTAAELLAENLNADAPPRDTLHRLLDVKSTGEVSTSEGKIRYQGQLSSAQGKVLNVDYEELQTRFTSANHGLRVDHVQVAALDGVLRAGGECEFTSETPSFRLSTQIHGVDLRQFAQAVLGEEPRRLRGRLKLDVSLSGRGREWQQIEPTLRGRGVALVTHGALINFNLAEQVLTKVTGIGGLRSFVPPSVRDRNPRIFNVRDTEFDELSGSFVLADRTARLKNVLLSAADFDAKGAGRVDLDARLNFRGTLSLSQRLTQDLTHAVSELEYITGKSDRLEIPFTVVGVLPQADARPDLSAIARIVPGGILRRGLEELKKRLPFPNQNEADKEDRPEESRPAEELIRKGLDWLLRR